MMFLNAFLAAFTVLGAIPIIIHLLNRSRFRTVEWAAIEFLLKTLQKNSRRLQLRDLILMLLRTFALIFFALALARPTISPGHLSLLGGAGGADAVIVLDNSLSMSCRDGTESRFDLAKKCAKNVLLQLPKGSGAGLVLMSDVAVADVAEPSHDLGFIAQEVDKAQPGDGGTDIATAVAKAWDVLKNDNTGREIYLITDLQANSFPAADNQAWRNLLDEIAKSGNSKIYVVDVGRPGNENLSIDDLAPADALVTTDSDSAFTVTVRNHGAAPAPNVVVDLLVDDGKGGELRKAAGTVIDRLEASQTVTLVTRFATGGRYRVAAHTGPDHLENDNSRYLAQDVVDRLRVLVVDGDGTPDAPGAGATFIRTALSPLGGGAPAGGGGNGAAGGDDAGGAHDLIDTEICTPAALATTPLDPYQVVILSDVADIPSTVADGLRGFVAGGHGLIAFLGQNVRPDRYNAELADRLGLFPGRIGDHPLQFADAATDAAGNPVHGIGFATVDLSHPVVAFFADPATQPFLAQPRFTQAWPIEMPDAGTATGSAPGADGAAPTGSESKPGAPSVVVRFSDHHPAIVARTCGGGEMLAFAAGADKDWSDFPLRPAFLMLLQRAVQHSVLGGHPPSTIRVHDAIRLPLPPKEAGAHYTLHDPRGGEGTVVPVLSSDGRSALAEVDDTPYAGFYDLTPANGDAMRFAANPPVEESNLDAIPITEVAKKFGGVETHVAGPEDDLAAMVTHGRVGAEIWPWLAALAILCLVLESVLVVRWAPQGN
jgi:hypothetical protein